jgi:hyperosmotically inducible periplasmic protein
MLRKLAATATLAVTLGAFGFAGPAAAADKENLQLFRAVQKQVLNYTHFTIFDSVNTQINDGTVVLTGWVTMPYKSTDIERRVSRVDGVTQVVNNIKTLPVSQFDDDLRLRIARAIYSSPHFRGYGSMVNPPIHIVVEHGRVTLEGVVNNNVDRMIARSIAANFLAFDVKNELKTTQEAKAELEKL